MKVLVTGATGMIGRKLLARLERPAVLSRDIAGAKKALGDIPVFPWDPEKGEPPAEAFAGIDAVVHLAGETVAGRWTDEKKRRIRDSRVIGTRNLVSALARLPAKPRVLISASAVGYYGSRGNATLDEQAASGTDFLSGVCREWEEAGDAATALGIRVVHPRTGIVLGDRGGALEQMLTPFKLGLGGPVGDGYQWWPWIHVDDVVGMILHAIETTAVSGAMNVVGPQPVTSAEFAHALGRVLHRPSFIRTPKFALKLALGEFSDALLASERVVPAVALKTGYRHRFASLEGALRDVLKASSGKH